MADKLKEMEFEEALENLESIVSKLEAGDLSLDEALKAYEQGVRLADICSKKLDSAQRRVEVLMKSSGGLKTVPFEEGSKDAPSKKKR